MSEVSIDKLNAAFIKGYCAGISKAIDEVQNEIKLGPQADLNILLKILAKEYEKRKADIK